MMKKEQTIDNLLGALTIEEKAAQLMVLGYTGIFVEPDLLEFIDKFGLGGLRLSPVLARKFIRYLPEGSAGIKNVVRPPSLREKLFDNDIIPPYVTGEEYAKILNNIRKRAFDRKHNLPLHTVIDCEAGCGSNFIPQGFITTPAQMGFGHLGDIDLVRRTSYVIGKQLKSMGIDMNHAPVVDVNTNPKNPEVYTRSYSEDHNMVTKCARASLEGLKKANVIACLKHYPGRGDSEEDAHFGISSINLERKIMNEIHIEPYTTLCAEGIVPAIMPAHSLFPYLDGTNEIATVSKKIINDILREEIGFDGVITTDSMTMGGLMAKYNVGQACVKAIEAGVDLLLLKDDNVLRWEMHAAIVKAVKSRQISEERINKSLRRIWSLKWDYGLFENGGIVDTAKIKETLENEEYIETGRKAAKKVIRVFRDNDNLLPLDPNKNVLIVDRVIFSQLTSNDSWNHPAMFWEFLLTYSSNVAYVDYTPNTMDKAKKAIGQIIDKIDMIVVTGHFQRGEKDNSKEFISRLKQYNKPIILISSNPYEELLIPKDIGTVIVTYGLMRDSLEAVSEFLYKGKQ